MFDINCFLKKIEDSKEQEKLREWLGQYNKRLEENALFTQEIISNDDYINWLIEFSNDYNNFSDDSWLYCPEEISAEDREKVGNLSNFFKAIDNYANLNYLESTPTNSGYTYFVKHNSVILEVGIAIGQRTLFYISRQEKDLPNVIEFRDIQEWKKTERAHKIDSIFVRLENVIDELHQEKLSNQMVLSKTNEILTRKIKYKT